MPSNTHGTNDVPGRMHPVLDIRYWEGEFPLKDNDRGEGGWISGPDGLAKREQKIQKAMSMGDLGPSVPSDVFVWANKQFKDMPYLTRIGGTPWRPTGKPWPRDDDGAPLAFLGQICFADSADILPCELPGEVALIFGTNQRGWISLVEVSALEWSPLKIESPEDGLGIPETGQLPYVFQGVLHRTVQYTDWNLADPVFKAMGYKEGGWGVRSVQATSIGAYADLPQGWPFAEGDGNTLIATLSSLYFYGKGSFRNMPHSLQQFHHNGREDNPILDTSCEFSIGDAGCIWIYRDSEGNFHLDEACG